MEIFSIISGIVSLVLGCSTILTYILFRKQSRQLKDIEVKQGEINTDDSKYEMYEKRIHTLNQLMENHNETFNRLSSTIDDLTQRLILKTDQIRKLTDDLIQSEQEQNELNKKLMDTMEELGRTRLRLQYVSNWVCKKSDCMEREPENLTLRGQRFEE